MNLTYFNLFLNWIYYLRKKVGYVGDCSYITIVINKMVIYSTAIMIVSGVLSHYIANITYVFIAIIVFILALEYLSTLWSAITSARRLVIVLFINILLALFIGAMLIYMIPKLGNPLISWLVIMAVYFVLWFTFCLLIDLKTSKLVNEVISMLLTVITGFLNVMLLSLPDNYRFTHMTSQFIMELNKQGYSTVQFMQVLVNVLLLPLLLCSGMTIIGIDIYTYWENKYK